MRKAQKPLVDWAFFVRTAATALLVRELVADSGKYYRKERNTIG